MSNSGWKRAFCRAQDTEAEGEKYFEGFFKKSKTVSAVTDPVDKDLKTAHIGTDDTESMKVSDESAKSILKLTEPKETEDDVERGGFCQPTGLASFFKDIMSSRSEISGHHVLDVDNQIGSDLPVVVVKENGMARQICRAWLKNNFLKLGEACKNPDCERRHVIDSCSVGTLYKDYSFKGLTAAQRNSIIAQVQSGAGKTVAKNATIISTTASAVEKVAEETKSVIVSPAVSPQSADLSVKTDLTCSSADCNPEIMKSVSDDCRNAISYIDSKKLTTKEASDQNMTSPSSSALSQGQTIDENKLTNNIFHEKIDSDGKSPAKENRLSMKKLRKNWMPVHKQITY